MPQSALAKKMKLKPGARAAIINAPEKYLKELKLDPDIAQKLSGKFDWIQVFAKNKKELDTLAFKAAGALKPESMLWLSFPKGASGIQTDLTRDKGWEGVNKLGLKWVNLVSVNDAWSAFGLRPYRDGEKKQPSWVGRSVS